MTTPPSSNRAPSDDAPVAIGDVIDDRYEVDELIGKGGMGAVYAAVDRTDNERVAIKVMRRATSQKEDSARRFLREARAARAIDSPHVAQVMGVGKLPEGTPYMTMELLEGQSLDKVIRHQAPLPVATAIDYLLQACEGVACAHALGIVHRDLKPSNLHLTEEGDSSIVKVLDFGIAKATVKLDGSTDNASLTESSSTLGSPQYMSPEQLRSAKDVDARSDIWALGLILHKMLTGKAAFEAESVGAQFAMIISDPPTPLRQHRSDATSELEEVILCCLQKNVAGRFQDVGQLAEALLELAPEQSAERVTRIRRLLDEADASATSLPIPSASWSADAEASTVAVSSQPSEIGETTAATRATTGSTDRARQEHGARNLVVMAAAVVAAGAIAYAVLRTETPPDESSAATTATTSAALAVAGSDESDEPDDESTSDAATVAIHLTLTPPNALVELDGVLRRANPIGLPRSERTHDLVVSAPGYATDRRQIPAAEDAELTIELRRRIVPGRVRPPPSQSSAPASPPTPTGAATPPPETSPPPPPPPSGPKLTPKGPIEDTL